VKYLQGVSTLRVSEEKCNGCGVCTLVCPHGVLVLANGSVGIVEQDACMECGACAMNCPTGAVTVRAGVGCAQAIINSALGRTSDCCCSTNDYGVKTSGEGSSDSGCGCENTQEREKGTGCC